jgi:23S rRNA (uracil1939-C5)-methyltransferase
MKKYRTPRTLLVLDPPRKGCDPSVIHSVIAARPSDVIYLSCDPATLARDLKLLSAAYAPVFVRPYDMFPQTAHVETLVRLKLRV